jgi:hypothetical protein
MNASPPAGTDTMGLRHGGVGVDDQWNREVAGHPTSRRPLSLQAVSDESLLVEFGVVQTAFNGS